MSIDTTTCETFDEALDRVCESMTGSDVMEELHDVKDSIAALLKQGKAQTAGELIQAVFDAYVERVAARNFYGHPIMTGDKYTKSAQEAAAAVMAK
jgi:hypothetical protein